jgi:probable phosphoglycerate mutase
MAGKHHIWLIRHGETEWSADGRHTGRTDVPLTPLGRRQAEALGRRVKQRHFALTLCSPLSRALDTCRLSGADEPEITDALLEWDYGEIEGRKTTDIRKELGNPKWTIWIDGTPGGETPEMIARRVRPLLERITDPNLDGDVALFSHGHLLRILAATYVGLPARNGHVLALNTASISILGHEHETPVIRGWDEDWHLTYTRTTHGV